jgi:hypothetical protein
MTVPQTSRSRRKSGRCANRSHARMVGRKIATRPPIWEEWRATSPVIELGANAFEPSGATNPPMGHRRRQ